VVCPWCGVSVVWCVSGVACLCGDVCVGCGVSVVWCVWGVVCLGCGVSVVWCVRGVACLWCALLSLAVPCGAWLCLDVLAVFVSQWNCSAKRRQSPFGQKSPFTQKDR
jgi:hypothetical protein